MSASAPDRPPSWAADPLVACADGPLVNQWFTRDGWSARVEAARYMHEDRGQRRQPCLDYVFEGSIQHPKWPQVRGEALRYRARRAS